MGSDPRSGELAGVHVLVVDDDEDARLLLAAVLRYAGALVTLASSAPSAVQVLERVLPDVVVTDIAMPSWDGYWLLAELRRLPAERGGRIPIIAVTAFGQRHGPDRTLGAGFSLHLRKPVDPRDLVHAIATLFGRR